MVVYVLVNTITKLDSLQTAMFVLYVSFDVAHLVNMAEAEVGEKLNWVPNTDEGEENILFHAVASNDGNVEVSYDIVAAMLV